MGAMASQITSLTIVHSTVYSLPRSKKTSKLRITGLCEENSPVIGEFPAQRASNAENVSIDDVIIITKVVAQNQMLLPTSSLSHVKFGIIVFLLIVGIK